VLWICLELGWCSVVSLVTRLQAGWFEVPFLAGAGDFFHSQKCPDCLWRPLTLWCSGYCPLTCILVPSLRTGGTVLPLIVYHGLYKVSCTFTFMPYMSNPVLKQNIQLLLHFVWTDECKYLCFSHFLFCILSLIFCLHLSFTEGSVSTFLCHIASL
jgi:hypothetical protein